MASKRARAHAVGPRTAASPTVADQQVDVAKDALAFPGSDGLHRLAEEFGRLLARRLATDRRGYSLIELVLGALLVAIVTVLAADLLRWITR